MTGEGEDSGKDHGSNSKGQQNQKIKALITNDSFESNNIVSIL